MPWWTPSRLWGPAVVAALPQAMSHTSTPSLTLQHPSLKHPPQTCFFPSPIHKAFAN